MTSRRRLLLGLGATVALGGCAASSHPSARIREIRLDNETSARHRFALTLSVDRRTAYEETHAVGPSDPELVLARELPDERGRLTLDTEVLGTGATESVTFERDDCYDLLVEYSDGGLDYFSRTDAPDCRAEDGS